MPGLSRGSLWGAVLLTVALTAYAAATWSFRYGYVRDITTIPVILFCNFFRLLCWAVLQVYVAVDPASALPRNVSMILSLCLSYALFVLVSSARLNLFVEVDEDARPQGAAYV